MSLNRRSYKQGLLIPDIQEELSAFSRSGPASSRAIVDKLLSYVDRQMQVDDLPHEIGGLDTNAFKLFHQREVTAVKFASQQNIIAANAILHNTTNDIEKILITESMAYAYAKVDNVEQVKEMLNFLSVSFRFSAVKANLAYHLAGSASRAVRDEVDNLIATSTSRREKNAIYINAAKGFAITKQYTMAFKIVTIAPDSIKADVLYGMLSAFAQIDDVKRIEKITKQTNIKTDLTQIALFTLIGYIMSGNKTKIDAYIATINDDIFKRIAPKLAFYLAANNQLSYYDTLINKAKPMGDFYFIHYVVGGYASVGNVVEVNRLLARLTAHYDLTDLCNAALYHYAKSGYMQLVNQLLSILNEDIKGSFRHYKFLVKVVDGLRDSRCFNSKAMSLNTLCNFTNQQDSEVVAKIIHKIPRSTTFSMKALLAHVKDSNSLILHQAVKTNVQAYTWISMSKQTKELYLLLGIIAKTKNLSAMAVHRVIAYLVPTHMNLVESRDLAVSLHSNRDAFFKNHQKNLQSYKTANLSVEKKEEGASTLHHKLGCK